MNTDEGGPDHPWLPPFYNPLFFHRAEYWSSRVLLEECGPLNAGSTAIVPIVLPLWDQASSNIRVGDEFALWDRGIRANGTILEIVVRENKER